jgi:hypothetical protein
MGSHKIVSVINNVISLGSFSKPYFLKLASFIKKANLDDVIIQLLQSEIAWPKAIPLSGDTAVLLLN